MNRKNIIEYLTGITIEEKDGMEIINAIEEAKAEIVSARSTFDNVDEPKLVELAIYAEEVALRRYSYLLSLAKERNIKVTSEYILDKCIKLAE